MFRITVGIGRKQDRHCDILEHRWIIEIPAYDNEALDLVSIYAYNL